MVVEVVEAFGKFDQISDQILIQIQDFAESELDFELPPQTQLLRSEVLAVPAALAALAALSTLLPVLGQLAFSPDLGNRARAFPERRVPVSHAQPFPQDSSHCALALVLVLAERVLLSLALALAVCLALSSSHSTLHPYYAVCRSRQ
jgi:hypothetical protein